MGGVSRLTARADEVGMSLVEERDEAGSFGVGRPREGAAQLQGREMVGAVGLEPTTR